MKKNRILFALNLIALFVLTSCHEDPVLEKFEQIHNTPSTMIEGSSDSILDGGEDIE
ncbi:hypothetical protein SAMN04488029_3164 [Reichenbachiella faecimaris]|uniref:Secreted protein n=1 Tax=Reichenbachiella faecimaris TaxID=692418 RepID=A0A1W2GJY4_REIFA|nr:hypothetical protein [Reichenbachiella faecimaris]SMD36960.1 hypothetical protein SAMN04488029_3164 [Reichenbachiella faecimaris]